MRIFYKGYLISQDTYNNHVCIYKDKQLVMHIAVDTKEKFTKEELQTFVDFWLED